MTKTKAQKARAKKANGNRNGNGNGNGQQPKKAAGRGRRRQRAMGNPTMNPSALMLHSAQNDSAVATFFRFRPGSNGRSTIIEGRDLAATAMSAASAAGAFVINVLPVTPAGASFLCTRWSTYAGLFCKWRINKLRATIVSGQPTTSGGFNYIAFDSTETATGDPATAVNLMRFDGSAMGVAYANVQTDFPAAAQLKWYDTQQAADSPTSVAGDLFVASDGYAAAVVPGKVLIDYEIEFMDPR